MKSKFQSNVCEISAKVQKSVCLLSTLHHLGNVDNSTKKKKPEVILFYNKNKTGIDCFD